MSGKENIATPKDLIKAYNLLVKGIEYEANVSENRAYGGVIRAGKGLLVENLTKHIITIAWAEMNQKLSRLSFEKETVKIPIRESYVERIKSPEVKDYIRKNIKEYYYPLKTDVHVSIDGKFVMAVECKAYTENAMLKRILVDFTLFKQKYPQMQFVLLQLESQLGGDYSTGVKKSLYGSPSTHTLLSYFDIDLNIITLLEGERKVDQPIHKQRYFKELREQNLMETIRVFKDLLNSFL